MEAMDDKRFDYLMGRCERDSKENVDRHIDMLNYDYMTEEEKVDLSQSSTTILPWSNNAYSNTQSKESFN